MHVIGLDVGTTGVKACVFDGDGRIRGSGFREYDVICSEPGMGEQDADLVWHNTRDVLAEAAGEAGVDDILALSLSVQGDAIIAVSDQFHPQHHAILGMDYRSHEQAVWCAEQFGERDLYERTGMRPHPMNSLVKMLWLRDTQPSVWKRARRVVTYADYILGRLCGEAAIDYTMASRTMAFDLSERAWAHDMLQRCDIDPSLLSPAVPSGTTAGTILPDIASALGLPADLQIVTGGHDQTCAALGAGVITSRRAVISTGTAEVLSSAFTERPEAGVMFDSYYPCYCHAARNMLFTFSLNHTGGILLRWFRDTLGVPEAEQARAEGIDPYQAILDAMPDTPSPVMVLPHFGGSGTPYCDLDSRGAIVGLSLSTTRHDIARAILESLCFELRLNCSRLRDAGIRHDELVAVGGGARSPRWVQMKANTMGCPVRTLAVREAACLGAGILAGVACGLWNSVEEAVQRTVTTARVYEPDSRRTAWYDQRYEEYLRLYPTLRPLCSHP